MGVPALFRWLSQKYPKIVSSVIEEEPQEVDGQVIPVDYTKPNPNGEEMDNLYLDMNGIVHPCSHPEDRPAPETEEDMMSAVFEYTDRVVNMVRPRKLLMIAVDGVAPRAKMNQQRSRRFRSAQEAKEKEDDTAAFIQFLEEKRGTAVDASFKGKKTWDSNAITPGTPFMDILAMSLRYWCAYKLNTDPAWANVKVIISDSTVPGEGEHKIMEFIRSQRANPEHDPNTRHVIYGLDADLIMLGLGTHEPHFRVLREDVFAGGNKSRDTGCQICGQKGHSKEQCTGKALEKDYIPKENVGKKPFIWLHVEVLREYLEVELQVEQQGFRFDLERALDDWVFMCFFVGNDFLPHLPSLEIRDGGIDTLIQIWRDNLPVMGGYLTKDGSVELERVQYILDGLAKQEDAIFRRRRQAEERREESAKRRRTNGGPDRFRKIDSPAGYDNAILDTPSNKSRGKGKIPPSSAPPPGIPLMKPGDLSKENKKLNHDMVVNREDLRKANLQNKSAAQALKSQLLSGGLEETRTSAESPVNGAEMDDGDAPILPSTPASAVPQKRKADMIENGDDAPKTPASDNNEMPPDTVKLWEPGYRDRYYEQKFNVSADDHEFRHKVAAAYVEGLCWVLLYYFQGCPSWTWYYPYHYAPFAQDFKNVEKLDIKFSKGTPFKPFEQLMGVLPAASKHNLPEPFQKLMTEADSEIIDFYPEKFPIDLNGKKFAWQGVALLPFIDETRLLDAAQKIYPSLAPEDASRNAMGHDVLLVADANPLYEDIVGKFYSKKQDSTEYKLNMRKSQGLAGIVKKDPSYIPLSRLTFPLKTGDMPDLEDDRSMTLHYEIPKSKNVHKSMLLRGVKFNPPALTRADIEQTRQKAQNSGRSYGGANLYRGNGRGRGGRGGGGFQGSFQSDRAPQFPPPGQFGPQNFGSAPGIPPPSYGFPPPLPGPWGNAAYNGAWPPQPPAGVREAGSYYGPPPGQGRRDDRGDDRYRPGNSYGGRGGNGSYGRRR